MSSASMMIWIYLSVKMLESWAVSGGKTRKAATAVQKMLQDAPSKSTKYSWDASPNRSWPEQQCSGHPPAKACKCSAGLYSWKKQTIPRPTNAWWILMLGELLALDNAVNKVPIKMSPFKLIAPFLGSFPIPSAIRTPSKIARASSRLLFETPAFIFCHVFRSTPPASKHQVIAGLARLPVGRGHSWPATLPLNLFSPGEQNKKTKVEGWGSQHTPVLALAIV